MHHGVPYDVTGVPLILTLRGSPGLVRTELEGAGRDVKDRTQDSRANVGNSVQRRSAAREALVTLRPNKFSMSFFCDCLCHSSLYDVSRVRVFVLLCASCWDFFL